MPTDPKNKISNQEEIDLLYLFVKFGEFLKNAVLNLVKFIGAVLIFLVQKWYYFAMAIVLAVLSAFILNKSSDPYFHSHLTLRSNATHNQPIMSNLARLGEYADAKNIAALSEELNLSIEDASAIKGLDTYWYYDIGNDGIFDGLDTEREFLSDTSIVKIDSVFSLRAEVYNSEVLEKLEDGLLFYLKKNSFLESLNKQRLSNLEAQLGQIEYEIEKLDSLQKREYYTNPDELRQKEGQIVFTSEKVVRMYHSQMLSLLEMKQECERDLNIYGDVVTILEGFTVPIEPDNGTIQYAKKLVWYFLGLALLLSVLITFRKRIFSKISAP